MLSKNFFGMEDGPTLYKVRSGDSLSKILLELYGTFNGINIPTLTMASVGQYLPVLMENNPHISNPDQIYPGMLIDVSLFPQRPNNRISLADSFILRDLSSKIDFNFTHGYNKALCAVNAIRRKSDFTNHFLTGSGILFGSLSSYNSTLSKAADLLNESLQKVSIQPKRSGTGTFASEFERIMPEWEMRKICNGLSEQIKKEIIPASNLSKVPKNTLKLPDNLNAKHVKKLLDSSSRASSKFNSLANKVSFVSAVALGTIEIVSADSDNRGKVIAQVAAGSVGSFAGSFVGTKAAIGVCLFFGVTTGGVGFIACGIVGGVGVGMAGDWFGRNSVSWIYDSIEL